MTLSKNHYLHLKSGRFDQTDPADLDDLFRHLATDPDGERLVLHFHGGLVSDRVARKTAETLLPHYRGAGGYPVFFIWQSGLLEVLGNNLGEIFKERIYQRLLTLVLQFVEAKLRQGIGGRGERLELKDTRTIGRELRQDSAEGEPFADLDPSRLPPDEKLQPAEEAQFREALEMDSIFTTEAEAIANGLRPADQATTTRGGGVQRSSHTLISPEVLEEIEAEAPTSEERGLVTTARLIKGAVMILSQVIVRLVNRRDHGVYSSVVEEILREFYLANVGKLVWDVMKGDTADAFKPDPAQYGGTAFLQRLKAHWEAGHRPRIVLIGHSTGAVYICHFLRQAALILPPEMRFEIVFLAPACDFDLLAAALNEAGERVQGFRSFGMADDLEARDRLVPLVPVYPRSLLYFVSGVLEDEPDKPLTGMERYYSGQAPYDAANYPEIERVRHFLAQFPARQVWSREDLGEGLRSTAAKHGAFDDEDEATLESVVHIIREGLSA